MGFLLKEEHKIPKVITDIAGSAGLYVENKVQELSDDVLDQFVCAQMHVCARLVNHRGMTDVSINIQSLILARLDNSMNHKNQKIETDLRNLFVTTVEGLTRLYAWQKYYREKGKDFKHLAKKNAAEFLLDPKDMVETLFSIIEPALRPDEDSAITLLKLKCGLGA